MPRHWKKSEKYKKKVVCETDTAVPASQKMSLSQEVLKLSFTTQSLPGVNKGKGERPKRERWGRGREDSHPREKDGRR